MESTITVLCPSPDSVYYSEGFAKRPVNKEVTVGAVSSPPEAVSRME